MSKEKAMLCLYTIAKELIRSFEHPVILLTYKDFAADIFNSLIDLHAALLKYIPDRALEIVNRIHFNWLQAVEDIEHFKYRVNDTPRETILKAIDFTMESVARRSKLFEKYIKQIDETLEQRQKMIFQADIDIIEDMQNILFYALKEKEKCLLFSADKCDFITIIVNETEELLNWLDRINDYLAVSIYKVLGLKVTLPTDLTKTLHQIIDEVASDSTPEAQKIAQDLNAKYSGTSIAGAISAFNEIEITKVLEKIKNLEDRISRLMSMNSDKSSAGIMALKHKTLFLEDKLKSLENLKLSLNCLRHHKIIFKEKSLKTAEITEELEKYDIFNHFLPREERCRLVERYIRLWQAALGSNKSDSFISILSAADIKEEFQDEFGQFTVDKYGRKIYSFEKDDHYYQVNEKNELVVVKDDEKHVYSYDECGRYYLDDQKLRVYKAHGNASEYLLHKTGVLLKHKEVVDNVEYMYDKLGRYYIDADGCRIYRERNSVHDYHSDNLGNLVRIQDKYDEKYENCPPEPLVLEECIYLKETVGKALTTCLSHMIMVQPSNPINYLADMLMKYRCDMAMRKQKKIEEEQMMAERKRLLESTIQAPTPAETQSIEEEEYTTDDNFANYETEVFEQMLDRNSQTPII